MYNTHAVVIDSLDFNPLDAKQGNCDHHENNSLISVFPLSSPKNIFIGKHGSEILFLFQKYL
jgi:hypothetical protein